MMKYIIFIGSVFILVKCNNCASNKMQVEELSSFPIPSQVIISCDSIILAVTGEDNIQDAYLKYIDSFAKKTSVNDLTQYLCSEEKRFKPIIFQLSSDGAFNTMLDSSLSRDSIWFIDYKINNNPYWGKLKETLLSNDEYPNWLIEYVYVAESSGGITPSMTVSFFKQGLKLPFNNSTIRYLTILHIIITSQNACKYLNQR